MLVKKPSARSRALFYAVPVVLILGAGLYTRGTIGTGDKLIIAATEGDASQVESLLSYGAPIEARDHWTQSTPLILAASAGNENSATIMTTLLRHGANINARNGNGSTALIMATQQNEPDSVRILIGQGADIQAANTVGHTALFLAHRRKLKEIEQMLTEAGAKK